MSKHKRLFIFAGYDKDGIIDDTLLYYLNSLSEFGDIIFTMDNDVSKTELKKLSDIQNMLYTNVARHNEYDFGSYKRGYLYAYNNKLLDKYNWIYFVNDSVYGPLWNLKPILEDLESKNTDIVGMIDYHSDENPLHIQSWFIGISNTVSKNKIVKDFFEQVIHQKNKSDIVTKYEVRFSTLLLNNGYKMKAFVHNENLHNIYQKPLSILEKGVPFIKKQALTNINCFSLLYQYTSQKIVDAIGKNADRIGLNYTKEYTKKDKFEKIYRLTFLSIPFCTILRKKTQTEIQYKIYIFDKVRILKIIKN